LYALGKPTKNLELLANCVNIGTPHIAASAAQKYNFSTACGTLALQTTEIWQHDGVAGAWVQLCFPFGAYVNVGFINDDPRFADKNSGIWFGIGYARAFSLNQNKK